MAEIKLPNSDQISTLISKIDGLTPSVKTQAVTLNVADNSVHELILSRDFSEFSDIAKNRNYRDWKISVYGDNFQEIEITIIPKNTAQGDNDSYDVNSCLFKMKIQTPRLIISSLEGGEGSERLFTVPTLDGIHSDFKIIFKYTNAPAGGNTIIGVEARK